MPDTSKMKKVAPGIHQHPSTGRYTVLYRVTGSRAQRSKTFDRLKDAKRFKAERDGDRAAGRRPPSASRQTVRQFYDEWIKHYRGRRRAKPPMPETVKSYRRAMEKHVLPVLGHHQLAALHARHINALVSDLELTLKPRSLQRTMRPLAAMLADAEDEDAIAKSPMRAVKLPGIPSATSDRQRGLTTDEQAALIGATPDGWKRLSIRTLLAAGLRQQELLALRWMDIRENHLRVEHAVKADGTIGSPKSAAGERAVPLAYTLVLDLKAWRAKSVFNGDEDLCFPNAHGGPMSTKNYSNRVVKPAAKQAGLEWLTGHNLRHSFVHRQILEGGGLLDRLHEFAGHSDRRTTLELYGHLSQKVLPEALPEPDWKSQGSQKVATPSDTGRSAAST